jgi:hypothetical protein
LKKNVNKHGLKRYVPSDIRAQIRRDAGFGCVICGCVFIDYEHIQPEFSDAKEHDPQRMTLLCIDCHGRVTRKLISKKMVWAAKENPKSLQDGFVHDVLFVDTDEMEIRIGNSSSKNTKTFLTIHGKPVIWFEPKIQEDEPSKLCAIFHNDSGESVSYINRNQFTALTNNQDIKSESTELSIIATNKKCLTIDREGGEVLKITKMEGSYLNTSVFIDGNDNLIVKQGESTFTLGNFRVENCGSAINLGSIPSFQKYNKLWISMEIATKQGVENIINLNGQSIGWFINNELINRKFEVVGILKNNEVYNICNEFIGNKVNNFIVLKDNCYESGEPIYTSQENIQFKNIGPVNGYDVSFRLFGNGI